MEQKQFFNMEDDSKDKKYFTIIPNYILNHSTAIDQAVYMQMKRLAGEEGRNTCYPSISYLRKQLKIGKKVLRKSIQYLITNKWIEDKGKRRIKTKGGYQWVQSYQVNDIWRLNMEYYQGGFNSTPLNDEKGGSEGSKGGSKGSKGGSVVSPKEEHIKEEPLKKSGISNNLTLDEQRRNLENLAIMKKELIKKGIIKDVHN